MNKDEELNSVAQTQAPDAIWDVLRVPPHLQLLPWEQECLVGSGLHLPVSELYICGPVGTSNILGISNVWYLDVGNWMDPQPIH